MAKEIRSFAELEREVNRRINKCLREEVTPLIKQEIQKSVDDVVYAAGTPTVYKRRGDNGGLRDVDNMVAFYQNGEVDIYNVAEASGKNFDPLDERLIYGYGDEDKWYNQPRPFMDAAQESVNRQAGEIVRLLDKAINK